MPPIALLNDTHFWRVTELLQGSPMYPADRGEHRVCSANPGLGICPGFGGTQQATWRADLGGSEDGEDPSDAFAPARVANNNTGRKNIQNCSPTLNSCDARFYSG